MTVYARIEKEKVRELVTTSADIKTLFHSALNFVDVTNIPNIAVGWSAKQIHGEWLFNAPQPPTQDMLIRQAMFKQRTVAVGGTSVNAGGVFLKVSTDTASLTHLVTLVAMAKMTPTASFPWTDSSGVTMLTAAQVVALNDQVNAFIQSTYSVLSLMVAAIKSGKIVSRSQIDDPPAPVPAWPKNT